MNDIVTQLRGHIAITTTFANDGFGSLVYKQGPSPICQEAADEIMQLRQQVTDLRDERDEARREVCALEAAKRDRFNHVNVKGPVSGLLAIRTQATRSSDIANKRGWDCFDVRNAQLSDAKTDKTSQEKQ